MKHILLCGLCFLFVSCSSQLILPSIKSNGSCFTNYKKKEELHKLLKRLSDGLKGQPQPPATIMATVGCLNYQVKNVPQAEMWLKKAFENKKDEEAQSTAAGALGLIYIKEMTSQKITPDMIASAENHRLGRWMLIIYYIDSYRLAQNPAFLSRAIDIMKIKHQTEGGPEGGETEETRIYLQQLEKLLHLESLCGEKNDQPLMVGTNPSAAQAPASSSTDLPPADTCPGHLHEKKVHIFSLTYGVLNMLLKEEHFRNITSSS